VPDIHEYRYFFIYSDIAVLNLGSKNTIVVGRMTLYIQGPFKTIPVQDGLPKRPLTIKKLFL